MFGGVDLFAKSPPKNDSFLDETSEEPSISQPAPKPSKQESTGKATPSSQEAPSKKKASGGGLFDEDDEDDDIFSFSGSASKKTKLVAYGGSVKCRNVAGACQM